MIKQDLNLLNSTDIYSLSIFVLYKLQKVPEYSALSELPYILDKENLLRFCKYFGGSEIKVPTVEEMYSIMNIILLYQYVNIEGKSYEEALNIIGFESKNLRKVKTAYTQLCNVLSNYDFKVRDNYE